MTTTEKHPAMSPDVSAQTFLTLFYVLHRCPSPGLPSLDGLPSAADILVHMAGHTAEKSEAVRESGGVCHHGDTDRS